MDLKKIRNKQFCKDRNPSANTSIIIKPRQGITKLTKKELVRILAKDSGLGIEKSKFILEKILINIINAVTKDDCKVTLSGFGIFEKFVRKARIIRNPQTGEKIELEARNAVRFRAGSKFKETIEKS